MPLDNNLQSDIKKYGSGFDSLRPHQPSLSLRLARQSNAKANFPLSHSIINPVYPMSILKKLVSAVALFLIFMLSGCATSQPMTAPATIFR